MKENQGPKECPDAYFIKLQQTQQSWDIMLL